MDSLTDVMPISKSYSFEIRVLYVCVLVYYAYLWLDYLIQQDTVYVEIWKWEKNKRIEKETVSKIGIEDWLVAFICGSVTCGKNRE